MRGNYKYKEIIEKVKSEALRNVIGAICFVLFIVLLFVVNFITNWLFGDNIFETIANLFILAAFVAIVATIPYAIANGILRLFRRQFRTAWLMWFAIMLVLFGVPNYYMQYQLKGLKDEFSNRARGSYSVDFTGEYNDGRPINEANYGGRLDQVVAERYRLTMRSQYLPFTQWWRVSDGWSSEIGIYIYTFLPKERYDAIVCYFMCSDAPGRTFEKYQEALETPLMEPRKATATPSPSPTPTKKSNGNSNRPKKPAVNTNR